MKEQKSGSKHSLRKIDRQEHIYSTLFNRIVSGMYNDDVRLKETELAEEFGVTRSFVRDIFRQLEQDGLINIIKNFGARALLFTADEVEDIFEVRKVLEQLAIDLSISTLSLQRLIEFRSAFQKAYDEDDIETLIEIDTRFHTYLAEASGRKRLILMLKQLNRLLKHFRTITMTNDAVIKDSTQYHYDIINAIMVRDVVTAKDLLRQHLEHGKISVLKALAELDRMEIK